MKSIPRSIVLLVLSATVRLAAQSLAADAQSMTDALKLRGDMAVAIRQGGETPESAISRLKTHGSPSGQNIDRDAGFAYAAMDVGQRLLAADKAVEAEKFFQEAEKALDKVIKKTPDSAARDKTQFLSALAHIRGNFLNKPREARADLETALRLQPNDEHLKQSLDVLANKNAEHFKDKKPRG